MKRNSVIRVLAAMAALLMTAPLAACGGEDLPTGGDTTAADIVPVSHRAC